MYWPFANPTSVKLAIPSTPTKAPVFGLMVAGSDPEIETGLPTCVPFIENVTAPLGALPPLLVPTVAIKVAPWGAPADVTLIVVAAGVMLRERGGDTLELKLLSPK